MLRSNDVQERLKDIEEFLLDDYKRSKTEKKRDWRTYEQQLAFRIKTAVRRLEPLIEEATSTIKVHREKGRKPILSLKQKVILLLLQRLFARSNRNMSAMVDIFSLLSGVDASYKTVERLYSDPEVEMAIHNLHVLILRKKGVKEVDASGDGTGYSLTVKKHYASEVEKKKDEAKESSSKLKGKSFTYSFKLLDLNSKMYIAFGMSMKSEKQAFNQAKEMLNKINSGLNINLNSIRLDKYYSNSKTVSTFDENTKVYVIPKKKTTIKGSKKWKNTLRNFLKDTPKYLEQYYQREHSEAHFSADKKWFGWKVGQKRTDRIQTALTTINVWHNLLNFHTP